MCRGHSRTYSYESTSRHDSKRYRRRRRKPKKYKYSESLIMEAKNDFKRKNLPKKIWPDFLKLYRYLVKEKKYDRNIANQAMYSVFPVQTPDYTQEQLKQFKDQNKALLFDIETLLKMYAKNTTETEPEIETEENYEEFVPEKIDYEKIQTTHDNF